MPPRSTGRASVTLIEPARSRDKQLGSRNHLLNDRRLELYG